MPNEELAGRSYLPRVYRTQGRHDLHAFLRAAVERSGATVVYASDARRAPIYLGIRGPSDERLGVLVYPFRGNPPPIRGRQPDEHRLQVRYGAESTWSDEHPVAHDLAGVDVTVLLGIHLQAGLLIGLDPLLYDPLPMGISVEFKEEQMRAATRDGWHVWERDNIGGARRPSPRAVAGLETLVAFAPQRLLDYVRFERRSTALGLDPALRYSAALTARDEPAAVVDAHPLEEQFALTSAEILEIIADRSRLAVAVRGGVAEHHLGRALAADRAVATARHLDEDGQPDFEVTMRDGRVVLVECKNASPRRYVDGGIKVEVQKTRSSQSDPTSRFYRPAQFNVLAACLYAPTGRWEFRFADSAALSPHPRHPGCIAPLQRVDERWSSALEDALPTRF